MLLVCKEGRNERVVETLEPCNNQVSVFTGIQKVILLTTHSFHHSLAHFSVCSSLDSGVLKRTEPLVKE